MSANKKSSTESPHGGRPLKFNEPSRPVTTTLPKRTLSLLASIDKDRATAIVKAVDRATRKSQPAPPCVEILTAADSLSVIMVSNNSLLRTIPWLSLLEVVPGRFLLSMKSGTPIEKLELALVDLIEMNRSLFPEECESLAVLLEQLRAPRRSQSATTEEILLIRQS